MAFPGSTIPHFGHDCLGYGHEWLIFWTLTEMNVQASRRKFEPLDIFQTDAMKKTATLILLFLFGYQALFAQKALIDSLESVLSNEHSPKHQIDLLCGLCRLYLFTGEKDQALRSVEKAAALSQQFAFPKGEIIATVLKANLEFGDGAIENGINHIRKAYDQARALDQHDLEVFSLYQMAEYYAYDRGDHNTAERLLLDGLKLADASVTQKNLGNLYKTMGFVYDSQGKLEEALAAYHHALACFETYQKYPDIDPDLGRPSAMGADKCLYNVSQTHSSLLYLFKKKGDLDQAYFHANKSIEIAEQLGAKSLLAFAYHDLGTCEEALGRYSQAIVHFTKGLAYAREQKANRDEVVILSQLGYLHQNIGEWKTAKDYYSRSLRISESIHDSTMMIRGLEYLSITAAKLSERTEQASYLKRAMAICTALRDSVQLPRLLLHLAELRQNEGNTKEALQLCQTGIGYLKRFQNNEALVSALSQLTDIYLQASSLDSAFLSAQQMLHLAVDIKQRSGIRAAHRLLSEILEKKGDPAQALYHQKAYAAWGDSLRSDEAIALLKAQQVKQKVEDYQAETDKAVQIAVLLRNQNRIYLGIAIGLFAVLVSIGYFYLKLRQAKAQIFSQNSRLYELNQTKDKFFGIVAHDLRNPISAFQGVGEQLHYYLEKGDTVKLRQISTNLARSAANLSNLLDNLLSWALLNRGMIPYRPESLSLASESAKNLEIHENAALAKDIRLENHIPGNLKVLADRNALQAILRNLVGNALKFTPKGGSIQLNGKQKDGKVWISVQDTGTGMTPERLAQIFSLDKRTEHGTAGEKGVGLGLLLCKELLEVNKGTLSAFSTVGKGSKFEFSLPCA